MTPFLNVSSIGRTNRRAIALTLLAVGIACAVLLRPDRPIGYVRGAIIAAAAMLALMPLVASAINHLLVRLCSVKPLRTALLVGLIASGYLILTAFLQDRDLFPKTHDDCSYMIQMQMLARGRLWMPQHPLADFFDSFYLIVRPVYASQYFPGTALMYLPTIWLKLPAWVLPVLASGAAAAMLFLVVSELIDSAAGILAALWLISISTFRMASILLISQIPALLLGLVMIWGYLRWRKSQGWPWLVLIGAAAGWDAITRPVDAICYAAVVGIGIALDLRKRPPAQWARSGALVILAAAPFLTLQLIANKGITGHFLETPFRFYLDRDVPGAQMGFAPVNLAARPQSQLPQKQDYYRRFALPFIERHQPANLLHAWVGGYLAELVDTTMPQRLLIPLALAGLIGLNDRRRWLVFATLPLFVLLYLMYPIFLEHYAIAVIPAVALLGLLGAWGWPEIWPRFGAPLRSALVAMILVTCITSFWEVDQWAGPTDRRVDDETFHSPFLRQLQKLNTATDLRKPCVILFRYYSGGNYIEEPVYNWDVAWPDDAPIIRAHDLGPSRDREIVEYYAKRQPLRAFYLFDPKSSEPIQPLGDTSDPAKIMRTLEQLEPGK